MDMRSLLSFAAFCALLVASAAAAAQTDKLRAAAEADAAYLGKLYTSLHAHPELSLAETATAARMAAEVKPLGYTVTSNIGGTGVVAVLVNDVGPILLIRTDMDALPVHEETGLPYASTVTVKSADGSATPVMHACGHDIHMSVWVGVARAMAKNRSSWSGTLVMIAQPAEEVIAGASAMLKDGLYTRFPKPQFALALHDSADIPAGTLSVPPGPALAAGSSVDIKVRGVGGHGAYPATTHDPVTLAASIVTGLQTLVSRENDPFEPAVITVGSIHGGTKRNIISNEVDLALTVRSYDMKQQARLLDGIARVAKYEALAAGTPADLLPEVKLLESTPPTLNTPAFAAKIDALFVARFGKDRVLPLRPSMASEDFNAFGLADPSISTVMFWLGATKPATFDAVRAAGGRQASLHSSKFAPDYASAITTGVEAMTAAAMMVLAKP
jgi:hippurate hydrolase